MADGTKAIVDTSETDGAATEAAPGTSQRDTGSDRGRAAKGSADGAVKSTATGSPKSTPQDAPKAGSKGSAKPRVKDTPTTPLRPTPAAPADEAGSDDPQQPLAEATAPLSAQEIDAELAAQGAARAERPSRSRGVRRPLPPIEPSEPAPATSTETLDADTATLPTVLPAPPRHSGDKIGGRYRLEECISESDTFTSWRAVDEKLRRAVGVHLLSAGHRRAKSVLTAARSAALLGDPRFVQVLDAVQEGELVYVVREWLPGARDLAELLADGPLEPYDAYQMVRQVTDAIAAAHQRGQAHLRLTPKCVLRTDGGQYRINGIAVDAALRGLPTENAELTDVRAIGALLYASLTHRWPYPEDRYDLQGLPKDLGCVPPDQVRAGVHKGLAELAARILCEQPPHHKAPITTPAELAAAIAELPKIRPPEQPAPPTLRALPTARPRYSPAAPTQAIPTTAPAPAPAPVAPRPAPRRRSALRRVLKWTASLVALSAVTVGSWQAVDYVNKHDKGTTNHSSPAPTPSGSAPAVTGEKLAITSVSPFNAYGDTKDEHPSEIPNATDGNPATTWTTQRYNDQFGDWRPGTGLLIDLGSARAVGSVDVQLIGSTKVELRAAPTGATTAPTPDDNGFKSLTSIATGSGTKVTLKPTAPVSTRYLLVWLTNLPTGDDGGYRGKIAEIQVNG
ncbi:serine/threonine protein kinase [Kitasatospora sp. NPDC059673]|uniref:protein kinase family protein n=1 Tax=Kitasatospora sp. NPDC059673 TaxID=3346901 RepID=UPI00367759D8